MQYLELVCYLFHQVGLHLMDRCYRLFLHHFLDASKVDDESGTSMEQKISH